MGAAARFDRQGVIRHLEARGLSHDSAEGIADVLEDHVLPQAASRRGEASARGRLTSRINTAFDQISDLVTRVGRIEDRLARVEETMATKADLTALKAELIIIFGGMLAAAVGFLTVVQAFLK